MFDNNIMLEPQTVTTETHDIHDIDDFIFGDNYDGPSEK